LINFFFFFLYLFHSRYYDLKAIRPDLIKFVVENAKDPKEKEKGESLLQKGLDLKANKELEEYIYHREVIIFSFFLKKKINKIK